MATRQFSLILFLCSVCFGVSPTLESYNTGQVTPLLEGRTDFQKYNSSNRTLENMFVYVEGPAVRRPGTRYIAKPLGAVQDIEDVGQKYEYIAHAHGGKILTMTNNTPAVEWTTTDVNANVLAADVDKDGYVVISQSFPVDDEDAHSPLLLFDRDGNNQNIDFEFSSAAGDNDAPISNDMPDCWFSPDGTYIYLLNPLVSGRIHKYKRDGTRVWRSTIDDVSGDNAGMAVDEDGYIYIPEDVNKHPAKWDASGSNGLVLVRDYSDITYIYGESTKRLCLSQPLGKVYIGSQAHTVNGGKCVVALDMDSASTVTWDANALSTVRYLCTDHNSVFVFGLSGDFTGACIKKLNGTTLALEAETNVSYASRIWMAYNGYLAVGVDGVSDKITYLDTNDLSEISTHTLDGSNFLQQSGLGNSRRESYYGWPDDEVVVKVTGHGYSTGDSLSFRNVGGATELNGNTYTITKIDTNYFYLDDTDIADFTDYTSGGTVSGVGGYPIRLVPFEFSTDDSCVLALGNGFMGFFRTIE